MLLSLLATLCTLAACARADCEACVDGWCHTRQTLVEGFHITSQLAVDHTYNVLYLQLNNNLLIAVFLDDLKIKFIQSLRTSGMTVGQDTHDLYVADYNSYIYIFKYGSTTPEVFSINKYEQSVDLLFHNYFEKRVYYSSQQSREISVIDQKKDYFWCWGTRNLSISDFVLNYRNTLYYVNNDKVFALNSSSENSLNSKLVMDKSCTLSIDKRFNVYLADPEEKVIYKLNDKDDPVEYAAYKTGVIDKFVFGRDDNIIFHDLTDGSVGTWKKEHVKCKVYAPQARFIDVLDEKTTSTRGMFEY